MYPNWYIVVHYIESVVWFSEVTKFVSRRLCISHRWVFTCYWWMWKFFCILKSRLMISVLHRVRDPGFWITYNDLIESVCLASICHPAGQDCAVFVYDCFYLQFLYLFGSSTKMMVLVRNMREYPRMFKAVHFMFWINVLILRL